MTSDELMNQSIQLLVLHRYNSMIYHIRGCNGSELAGHGTMVQSILERLVVLEEKAGDAVAFHAYMSANAINPSRHHSIGNAFAESGNHDDVSYSSVTVVKRLNAGDSVLIRTPAESNLASRRNIVSFHGGRSTFSGWRIF
uniref:Uncharacterized protein n=1 Tax=Magallana gigas TaxID=29159 RepID=A0A8W8P094_MAGGI